MKVVFKSLRDANTRKERIMDVLERAQPFLYWSREQTRDQKCKQKQYGEGQAKSYCSGGW